MRLAGCLAGWLAAGWMDGFGLLRWTRNNPRGKPKNITTSACSHSQWMSCITCSFFTSSAGDARPDAIASASATLSAVQLRIVAVRPCKNARVVPVS